MIKGVIFDMDGVIVDSEPVYLKRTLAFLKSQDIIITDDHSPNQLVGCDHHHFSKVILEWTDGLMDADMFFRELKKSNINNPIDFPSILDPNVVELLEWLQDKEISVAIASSSPPHDINNVVTSCKLDHLIAYTISGFSFPRSKPDPAIYIAAAKKLGVPVTNCLAIEDSSYGIEAAKRANIKVLAKRDTRFGMDQRGANGFIDSLLDIKKYID